MLKEFKEFAMRGNVIDLAVGIIIGAAFGRIVTSLVNDIIMPIVGVLTNGANFNNRFVALSSTSYETIEEAQKAGVAVLKYGSFVQSVLDFVIVAFCIFLVIRQINRWTRREEVKKA
jgi:large conductance mechanosensitive channel